jgi:hypothetical protein
MTLAIVCGMKSEADVIGDQPGGCVVIIGAGDAAGLRTKIEAAIADGADRVISVGVCGALDPHLPVGAVVVGEFDAAWADRLCVKTAGRLVIFSWSAVPIASPADKARLALASFADVIDMETWVADKIASAHGLPFAALRVVLDPADFDLPPVAMDRLTASGGVDYWAALESVAGDPEQIPEMVKLAGYSRTAFARLRAALALVGGDFCAYR